MRNRGALKFLLDEKDLMIRCDLSFLLLFMYIKSTSISLPPSLPLLRSNPSHQRTLPRCSKRNFYMIIWLLAATPNVLDFPSFYSLMNPELRLISAELARVNLQFYHSGMGFTFKVILLKR